MSEKLAQDDPAQSSRFEAMARDLGVEDKPDVFDATFMAVAHYRPKERPPEPPKK